MPDNQQIKVAVDAIVFGYSDQKLQLLLIQIKYGSLKGKWALPGGFVKTEESLKNAVNRELLEETGIKVNYLEQLFTFGDDIQRDPRQRVISVAYFALVNSQSLQPAADTDAEHAAWFSIDSLPSLAYDHSLIIKTGIERLQSKLQYQPIGFDLLPKYFLFSDVEQLYTTLLGTAIDRRNFRKKLISFGFIEETEKFASKKTGRPAKLFKFNKQKYKQLENEGMHFEIKLA